MSETSLIAPCQQINPELVIYNVPRTRNIDVFIFLLSVIGLLQQRITWYTIPHTGRQKNGTVSETKRLQPFKLQYPCVGFLSVGILRLPLNTADFVPCDRSLPKASCNNLRIGNFQVLKGHSSAVTHIIVNSDKGEIISAAQDKVIVILYYHSCIKITYFAIFNYAPSWISFIIHILCTTSD